MSSPASWTEVLLETELEDVVSNRRAEPRYDAAAIPAIASVRAPGGEPLTLVNISATGILVEGQTRIKPGERLVLSISGLVPSQVPGRVVRSVVSSIGGSGSLCYQTGIAFEHRVNLPLPVTIDPPAQPAAAPEPSANAAAPPSLVRNRW
jgi:PilZ domain-containing protein